MKQTYTLMNAVEQNELYAETFIIPDFENVNKIKVNQLVKIIFGQEGKGYERMWVRVTKVLNKKDGIQFTGVLDNIPTSVTAVRYGETVKFSNENIIEIGPLLTKSEVLSSKKKYGIISQIYQIKDLAMILDVKVKEDEANNVTNKRTLNMIKSFESKLNQIKNAFNALNTIERMEIEYDYYVIMNDEISAQE